MTGKNNKVECIDMKRILTKRILSVAVMFVILISSFSIIANAEEITPRFNNVASITSIASISDSGKLTVSNSFSASASVFTKAVITTYVEKRTLGIFWTRVDIGQTNDEWVDTIYTNIYTGNHIHQLEKKGTYRITVEYVVYGTGGAADVVTREIEKTY